MKAKNVLIIIIALAVSAIIGWALYSNRAIRAKFGYLARKTYRKKEGKPYDFKTADTTTDYHIKLPAGTVLSFSAGSKVAAKIEDSIYNTLVKGSLKELDQAPGTIPMLYAEMTWNELPGLEIRDFRFGVVYRLDVEATVEDVAALVVKTAWVKQVLDAISSNPSEKEEMGGDVLERALFILKQ